MEDVTKPTDIDPAAPAGEPVKPEEGKPDAKPASAEPTVDYKKQLEEYRVRAERAERSASQAKDAVKRIQKSAYNNTDDEPTDDEGNEPEDIKTIIRDEMDTFKREQNADTFDSVLDGLTDNPDERELVKHVYDTRIKATGYSKKALEQDLKEALAIANLPRLERQIAERAESKAKKSIAETQAASRGAASGGSGRQPPETDPLANMSPKERSLMEFAEKHSKR